MALSIKLSAFLILICCSVHGLASAQPTVTEETTASATRPTLVLMVVGSQEQRAALNPALDSLCQSLATELPKASGQYQDVVRLQPSTDLSLLEPELTPKDARESRGAVLRTLQGQLSARAFQRCDGTSPDTLPEPLEFVLLDVTYRENERVNVSITRYRLADALTKLEVTSNVHLNLFRDLHHLGECIGLHYWGCAAASICAGLGIEPPICPRTPRGTVTITNTFFEVKPELCDPREEKSCPPPPWHQWWFWATAGAVVVGSVVATIMATSGNTTYELKNSSNTPANGAFWALKIR